MRSLDDGKTDLTLEGDRAIKVTASQVVITTGGTGGARFSKLARLILPIQTFIAVSDPIPEILAHHIPTDCAIADTRRAGNYFRKLPDGRLLWGMGISALSAPSHQKINTIATKDIAAHLPELAKDMRSANINLAYAWSGTMGYARHFMPYVGQIAKNRFCVAGFGGHGMNTAPIAGKVIAEALSGNNERLEAFGSIPRQATFGAIGKTAAEVYYRTSQIKDALKERLA
jgi:gamma-glutamylputrescine oxidase